MLQKALSVVAVASLLALATLLTDRKIARGECAGHKVGYAEKGTVWEWIKIKLGLIR